MRRTVIVLLLSSASGLLLWGLPVVNPKLDPNWGVAALVLAVVMALIAGWLGIGEVRDYIRQRRWKLESWHLIAVGLGGIIVFAGISLGGVIWQRNSPQTAATVRPTDFINDVSQQETPAVEVKPAESYTSEERARIRNMLYKINQVYSVELKKIMNEVRAVYRPWLDRKGSLDEKQAAETIERINEIDKELGLVLNKTNQDLYDDYALYWDIALKILDRNIQGKIHPINDLRRALGRMASTLDTYKVVEKNLVSKPDNYLVGMMFPFFYDVETSANALDVWISDNAALIKQESDRFHAAK